MYVVYGPNVVLTKLEWRKYAINLHQRLDHSVLLYILLHLDANSDQSTIFQLHFFCYKISSFVVGN